MTATEAIAWDAHQQGITECVTYLNGLLASIPDGHQYTAARNRITMAMTSLDTARDFLAAARDRMPQDK